MRCLLMSGLVTLESNCASVADVTQKWLIGREDAESLVETRSIALSEPVCLLSDQNSSHAELFYQHRDCATSFGFAHLRCLLLDTGGFGGITALNYAPNLSLSIWDSTVSD